MTEQNPIFQEISEDLERQRMEEMWKRYGSWVIAFALLVVVGTAGMTAWNSWKTQKQQKATDELSVLIDNPNGDNTKQMDLLDNFAAKNSGETQAVFARLSAAQIALKGGDLKKAVAIYDEIANNKNADVTFRQLADLYSVQAQMDTGDAAALQQRLQPLLADNAPWRYTAMEESGFLALKAGNKDKAKEIFSELAQNNDAPPTITGRAGDMVRFLGQ